ncbi:MAG: shikimate dehydrogenase [Rikenellaceae bacterium]|nr:shikimate dehydrogenase [Rikenellaceae bacterium]
MVKRFGLIGYPLGHSFSSGYFTRKFREMGLEDCRYDNFPLETADRLLELIACTPDLLGLNVTIPYKQAVLPFLERFDPQAERIGAVNCIRITRKDGIPHLTGYNADAWGFRRSLLALIGESRPNALILGTGGASKAVAYVLSELGISHRFVSRRSTTQALSYGEVTPEIIQATPLIIHTTPLGTTPHTETLPELPYQAIGPEHFLHDLVYNPAQTAFLREGRVRGAAVKNGYAMLVGQAERSWEIWNGEVHPEPV